MKEKEGLISSHEEKSDGIESTPTKDDVFNGFDESDDGFDEFDDSVHFTQLVEYAERIDEKFGLKSEEDLGTNENVETSPPIIVDLTPEFYSIEEYFYTVADATSWIHDYGSSFGFVIVKVRSDLKRKSPYVEFGCERSGKPRFDENGKNASKFEGVYEKEVEKKGRDSFTKKDCCPFKLMLRYEADGDFWFFQLDNGGHNHEAFISANGHAYLGRLTYEERQLVWDMTKSGSKPANILKELRKRNPKNCTQPKTLYNIRAEMKRKAMQGRNVMQELFHLAEKSNSIIRYTRNDDNSVANMFWSFADCNTLARNFPHVFIMDCTYKTNRYKLPLLHIVGVTSTDMSYAAGFALLSSEVQESFEWALRMFRESLGESMPSCIITDKELALMNAITNVFPESKRLLCQWHISKAIGVATQRQVPHGKGHDEACKKIKDKWAEIIFSSSAKNFQDSLDEAKTWIHPCLIDYMESTWITDYKEQFVSAWIDEEFHLENTCTSRVEGTHDVLKGWLGISNLDLVTHWERVKDMAAQQVENIRASLERSLFKRPAQYGDEYWCIGIGRRVSQKALQLIHEEFKRRQFVGYDVKKCACYLRKTHRLPCAHELNQIFKSGKFISLDDIHQHWKTLSDAAHPLLATMMMRRRITL